MPTPVKLFISYAKDDRQQWLLPVRQHMLGAQRVGLIEIWEDSTDRPRRRLGRNDRHGVGGADIVLLLVSSAFTASEYCHREMTRALERRSKGQRRGSSGSTSTTATMAPCPSPPGWKACRRTRTGAYSRWSAFSPRSRRGASPTRQESPGVRRSDRRGERRMKWRAGRSRSWKRKVGDARGAESLRPAPSRHKD